MKKANAGAGVLKQVGYIFNVVIPASFREAIKEAKYLFSGGGKKASSISTSILAGSYSALKATKRTIGSFWSGTVKPLLDDKVIPWVKANPSLAMACITGTLCVLDLLTLAFWKAIIWGLITAGLVLYSKSMLGDTLKKGAGGAKVVFPWFWGLPGLVKSGVLFGVAFIVAGAYGNSTISFAIMMPAFIVVWYYLASGAGGWIKGMVKKETPAQALERLKIELEKAKIEFEKSKFGLEKFKV